MYNTRKMIEEGRDVIQRHPLLEFTITDFQNMREEADGDAFLLAENAFLLGVTVGFQVKATEQRK